MPSLTILQTLTAVLPVVLAAFVSGFISFLSIWSSDRRKTTHEDEHRWVRDLRDAAADFVHHCHDLEDAALLLHRSHDDGREPLSVPRQEKLWAQLFEARRDMVRSAALIALLAPEDVVSIAYETLELATTLGHSIGDPEPDYAQVQIEYSESIADFISTMRARLGVAAAAE